MRIAVMQPYLFPYLGYYQLVNAVDIFVFFDDVNYINKGWINRNNIIRQNQAHRFTLPLNKASQNRLINEIEISDYGKWKKEFMNLIDACYRKAPQFSSVNTWLRDFLDAKEYKMVSELTADSVKAVAGLLQLRTQFLFSSDLDYRSVEKIDGQEKILNICKILGADMYINPKNGVDLYNPKMFSNSNLELRFIQMEDINYSQFSNSEFVPFLSVVDVLMFNDLATVKQMINRYSLK